MGLDWNKMHQIAKEKHQQARDEASFMLGAIMSSNSIESFAFLYPDETKNYFKSRRLLFYIEKRIQRQTLNKQ